MLVAVVFFTAGTDLFAQDAASLPLLPRMPGSTRALGLGNAYPMASGDAEAIFYNPGLLDSSRGVAASMARYGSSSLLLSVAGVADWWRGGVGFGVRSMSYAANSVTEGAFARGEAGLSDDGAVAASENVGTAAYARTLFGFRVGLAGKVIDTRVAGEHEVTAAADVGIVRNMGRVTVGLAGRNLGRDPEYDGIEGRLPTEVTLAAGTRTAPVGELDLALAAAATWMRGGNFGAGGGVEISYWPVTGRTFTGRAGFRWVEDSDLKPLTLGAGFTGDRIALDYAFEGVDAGDAIHRLTVRLR